MACRALGLAVRRRRAGSPWGWTSGIASSRPTRPTAAAGLVQHSSRPTLPGPRIVQALGAYRRWADPELRRIVASPRARPERAAPRQPRPAVPVDRGQVAYLESRLLDAIAGRAAVPGDALRPHRSGLSRELWSVLEAAKPGDPRLLRPGRRLGTATTRRAPLGRPRRQGGRGTRDGQNPVVLGPWLEALRPSGAS